MVEEWDGRAGEGADWVLQAGRRTNSACLDQILVERDRQGGSERSIDRASERTSDSTHNGCLKSDRRLTEEELKKRK